MKLKNIVFVLSIVISCISAKPVSDNKQIQSIEYDSDFVDYILHKWQSEEYKKKELKKFDRINAFYQQLKIRNEDILSDYHMKRPDNNLLVAHYLDNKLQWNRFNRGAEKLSIKKVVEKSLNQLPERNEMLAFYYKTIFAHILNNQRNIEAYEKDLNFEQLDLNNQEGAIMFLCAMRHLGNQMSGYSSANFPDNCFRAKEFLKKIPRFNGKLYYNFDLPEFDDFPIEIDKRYPKVSFKKRFIPEFEAAKKDFKNCIKN